MGDQPHTSANRLKQESDLSRMGSVQSDSSGFGDAENNGDALVSEADILRVSSLGSSSESAVTLKPQSSIKDMFTQTSTDPERSPLLSPHKDGGLHSQSKTSVKPNHGKDDDSASHFVTMCFIPPLKHAARSGVIKQHSGATVSGHNLVLGKTRVSMVIPEQFDHRETKGKESRPVGSGRRKAGCVTSRAEHVPNRPDIFHVRTKSLADELAEQDDQSDVPLSTRQDVFSCSESPTADLAWDNYDRGDYNLPPPAATEVSVLNLSVTDSERGSRFSILDNDGSDYSYSSAADSTSSSAMSEVLDYRKLMNLVNQPITYKGKKRRPVLYKPKRHIRDWPGMLKKKRLQEETRLTQHALLRYKTELHILETDFLLQYHTAFQELSQEERNEVDELQFLWSEIHRQVLDMEQLLASRMKAVASGNDFFNLLSNLNFIPKMIELMKEQMYQLQIVRGEDEEYDADEDPKTPRRHRQMAGPYWSMTQLPMSPGWGMPAYQQHQSLDRERQFAKSMEELRGSLLQEFRQELRQSTQQLHLDIRARDNEIKRLQLELMEEQISQRSRSRPSHPRSSCSTPGRRSLRETTV